MIGNCSTADKMLSLKLVLFPLDLTLIALPQINSALLDDAPREICHANYNKIILVEMKAADGENFSPTCLPFILGSEFI